MAGNTSSKGGSGGRGRGKASNAALHDDGSYFRQWARDKKRARQDDIAARGMTYPKSNMHARKA